MKKLLSICLVVILLTTCIAVMGPTTSVLAFDGTATINLNNVYWGDYLGLGVQWDPQDDGLPQFTDTQWQMIYNRVDFMQAKFARVMINTSNYCTGVDGSGNRTYNWNSAAMQRLYKILDYCQSRGVTVMFGEWNKPGWASNLDDWRYIKAIGDCLNYLKNTKGYTCIKYYNFINEPNGDWMFPGTTLDQRWNNWYNGVRALYTELNSRGFLSWVTICGPDSAYNDDWVNKTADSLSTQVGQFEFHIYKDYDSQVYNGEVESAVASARSYVNSKGFSSRHLWLGELGMKEGADFTHDCQPRVANFDYGVLMSDAVVQSIRGGGTGVIPWDLDDAMHWGGGNSSQTGGLKKWGMWNTLGGQTVYGSSSSTTYPASDTNLRPWFYPMSLFARYFQKGSSTLDVSGPGVSGVRVAAIKKQNGSNWDVSIAIVNNSDTPRSILVQAPGVTNTATFKQYNYFNTDRPTDSNGYAAVKMDRVNNLSSGIGVDLPSKGVVFLTTFNGGTPISTGATPTPTPTPASTPTPTPSSGAPIGKTIWLKANANNNYVSAWLGGTNPLQARATSVNTWEKYDVVDAGNGYIALKAQANGLYVTAWLSGSNPLQAGASTIQDWEMFQWIDAGGGYIALKAKANGLYVSTNINGANAPLEASASTIQAWEKFQWGQ